MSWLRRVGIAIVILHWSSEANSAAYSVTVLPPINTGAAVTGAEAFGLNDAGQVVGYSLSRNPGDITYYSPVYWMNGTPVQLSGFFSEYVTGYAINNAGQVAGYFGLGGSSPVTMQVGAVGITALPVQNSGSAYAFSINNSGQVAGSSLGPTSQYQATVWSGGIQNFLGVLPGATQGTAYDINDGGLVVGSSEGGGGGAQATIWNGGVPTAIASPGSIALAVNNAAEIVGASGNLAMKWMAGNTGEVLDPLSGLTGSYALDINNASDVVGYSSGSTTRATLWKSGQSFNLNNMMDASGVAWTLEIARAINNLGQILAWAVSETSPGRTMLLLTPCDECSPVLKDPDVFPAPVPVPAALPLLATGLALIGGLRRRRTNASRC